MDSPFRRELGVFVEWYGRGRGLGVDSVSQKKNGERLRAVQLVAFVLARPRENGKVTDRTVSSAVEVAGTHSCGSPAFKKTYPFRRVGGLFFVPSTLCGRSLPI